ncbi:hypothetical protein MVEN_00026400 [Mycena venus]|uniref:Uncharacterized protein n=1 Tax=Mycena venus TaxID=2733690 RepID=A0A8H6Z321_9AGAR|nr:hypothetical protein MVEN_00026400 [Mycena venus]
MPHHNRENDTGPRPHSSRHRKVTARVQYTRDAQSAVVQALQLKKKQKAKRKALKQRQSESALTVERPEDTDEIRKLRAALVRTQGKRNAVEAANSRPAHRQGPAGRSIARPSNMSKVKMDDIRAELNLSGAQNDQRWADLRGEVRRYMDAGLHLRADSPDNNVFDGSGPRAPTHSPNASPSPPANNSPVASRGASRIGSLPVLTPEPEERASGTEV